LAGTSRQRNGVSSSPFLLLQTTLPFHNAVHDQLVALVETFQDAELPSETMQVVDQLDSSSFKHAFSLNLKKVSLGST
jgi:hypothetical protein